MKFTGSNVRSCTSVWKLNWGRCSLTVDLWKKISAGSSLTINLIWIHSNRIVQKEKSVLGCIHRCFISRMRVVINLVLCACWTITGVLHSILSATLEEKQRQTRACLSWDRNVWNHSFIGILSQYIFREYLQCSRHFPWLLGYNSKQCRQVIVFTSLWKRKLSKYVQFSNIWRA